MRWDCMRHMGNPAARTPYLDDFARKEAVSFSNAYCQNPVCVPSRCSFFTGLYPHVRGHRTMEYMLHPGEDTLFSELKRAGYHVWMNARNDLLAGQCDELFYENADEIFPWHVEEYPPVDMPSFGPRAAANGPADHAPQMPRTPFSHYEGREDVSAMRLGDDWADTRAAVERILTYDKEEPLCLFIGWNNPHVPYTCVEPYYSAIDRDGLPARIPGDGMENPPEIIRRLQRYVGMSDWTEDQWRELRATYLAQCMMVDDMFGRVCEALKTAGMYDDAAIFFLSDHGDFAGDYDLVEKAQNSFQDCLTKVPFAVKAPRGYAVDPGISASLVELVDLYATVMDFAQVPPSHTSFGKSLVPVLEDRSRRVREYAFCEGGRLASEIHCDEWHSQGPDGPDPHSAYWPKMTAQKDADAHEKGTMICDGQYKYVHRLRGDHEFYDLRMDPGEVRNLYPRLAGGQDGSFEGTADTDLRRQMDAMKEELLNWYQSTCDIVPFAADSRFTADQMWDIFRHSVPAQMEEPFKAYCRREHPDIMGAARFLQMQGEA